MSQNQEIIESKLCAYVDGELDPEGRAEIEKHLDANPQHRRLLESLRATRDLIRWLPREQAPPELAETLNGQLERSVLLDYEGDGMRIPIWPRIFAAAAIIALTVGLAAAVFYALPRSQKPALAIGSGLHPHSDGTSLTDNPLDFDKAPAAPTTDTSTVVAENRRAGDGSLEGAERGKDSKALREVVSASKGGFTAADFTDRTRKLDEAAPAPFAPASDSKIAATDLDQLAQQVAQNPGVFAASSAALNDATPQQTLPANGNAMVMLVRSDAPEQTEKQLTTYFKTQQMQWRQTQLPAQQLELNGAISNSNLQSQADGSQGNSQTIVAPQVQQQEKQQYAAKDAAKELGDAPIAGKIAKGSDLELRQVNQAPGAPLAHAAETQPTQLGSLAFGRGRETPAPVALAKRSNSDTQPYNGATNLPSGRFLANGSNAYRSNGVYVVQMSRRQAAQLCTTINDRSQAQAAETKDLPALALDNLNVTATGNGGNNDPRSEQQFAYNGQNRLGVQTTAPAADSAAAAGVLDHMKVAAARDGEFKYKPSIEKKAEQEEASTTRPAEVATSDKPGAGGGIASASFPTPKAQISGGIIAPSSQPVVLATAIPPATQPADEPLNVVILVEATASPAALVPAPTTQPIGQTEQQQSPPAAAQQPAQDAK